MYQITCPNCELTSNLDEHPDYCPQCQYEWIFGPEKVVYTRPDLTAEDKAKADADAKKLLKKYGYNNLPKMLAALCIENVRLTNEIQSHRAKLGIEPLKTFEV